jgi:hypothetical protein
LLGAIERGLGGAFAQRLLEDLQNHGTLAERTLRKIAETAGNDSAFNQLIKQLKDEMGIDYLDRLITTNADNEIIVAIEHL